MYPGAPINCSERKEYSRYGTLGGFLSVDHDQSNIEQEVYAVTTGHISVGTNGNLIWDNKLIGQFLGEWECGDPDINVAKIFGEYINQCDMMLKDDHGNPKKCALLGLENAEGGELVPDLIYINGATSGISKGEIHNVRFRMHGEQETYMLIRDSSTSKEQLPFCKPGDSGAIICSNDRRGRFVNILGILIGKFISREEYTEENLYLALHMNTGLKYLQQKYKQQFKFCGQYKERVL